MTWGPIELSNINGQLISFPTQPCVITFTNPLAVRLSSFEAVPARLAERVRATPSAQMPDLLDVALVAASLDEVAVALEAILANADPVAA